MLLGWVGSVRVLGGKGALTVPPQILEGIDADVADGGAEENEVAG